MSFVLMLKQWNSKFDWYNQSNEPTKYTELYKTVQKVAKRKKGKNNNISIY